MENRAQEEIAKVDQPRGVFVSESRPPRKQSWVAAVAPLLAGGIGAMPSGPYIRQSNAERSVYSMSSDHFPFPQGASPQAHLGLPLGRCASLPRQRKQEHASLSRCLRPHPSTMPFHNRAACRQPRTWTLVAVQPRERREASLQRVRQRRAVIAHRKQPPSILPRSRELDPWTICPAPPQSLI
jgi:hypothetical protein